ncbi:hypothetical protein ALC57_09257, partial [Trachymyrmex cornetzi]
ENIFIVPDDEYGHLNERTISEESIPYHPIEELSQNLDISSGNERSEGTYVICLCSKANQVILPCSHMCLCADCADIIKNNIYSDNKIYPLCDGQIESIFRIISS